MIPRLLPYALRILTWPCRERRPAIPRDAACRLLGLSAAVACVVSPAPASAEFGDCNAPEYWEDWGEGVPPMAPFDCLERRRLEIRAPDGAHDIRIIHVNNAAFVEDSDVVLVETAIRRVEGAFGAIGDFRFGSATILLTDALPDSLGQPDEEAGRSRRPFGRGSQPECRILVRPQVRREALTFVIAHEMFHCAQYYTLSAAQIAGRSDWWMEGSANWFAAVVDPERREAIDAIVRQFAQRATTTPLHAMGNDAMVFFSWYANRRGPASVWPLLGMVATDAGEMAQTGMLARSMEQAEWLEFAQDAIDGRIAGPDGMPLGLSIPPLHVNTWTGSSTFFADLPPFTIVPAELHLDCGRWRSIFDPVPMHATRPAAGGPWTPIPARIDTIRGASRAYRLAGYNASQTEATLTMELIQDAACTTCMGLPEDPLAGAPPEVLDALPPEILALLSANTPTTDACLVGGWHFAEQSRRQSASEAQVDLNREVVVEYAENGTFLRRTVQTERFQKNITCDPRSGAHPDTVRMEATLLLEESGEWAIIAGELHHCTIDEVARGNTTITDNFCATRIEEKPPQPHAFYDKGDYACDVDTLTVSPNAGRTPRQYTLTRVAPGQPPVPLDWQLD